MIVAILILLVLIYIAYVLTSISGSQHLPRIKDDEIIEKMEKIESHLESIDSHLFSIEDDVGLAVADKKKEYELEMAKEQIAKMAEKKSD